jgi:hypothetical protein
VPRLQVLNGKRQGALFDVVPGTEQVIGHRATASIPIDDPWVSWDHARLFFNGDGTSCYIEDLGSTNGTYVNCVRVKREQLNHEDIVFLGKTHVIFLAPVGEMTVPDSGSGSHLLGGATFAPTGISSEEGPFRSNSGSPPLVEHRDPFASAAAVRSTDPFRDSGVDPFSSGPDYSGFQGLGGSAEQWVVDPAPRSPTANLGNPQDLSFLSPKDPAPYDFQGSSRALNPFEEEDPVESSVIRKNVGGGFHANDLSQAAPPPPPPPPRRADGGNPFAETRGDEEVSPLSKGSKGRSLSLSGLDDPTEPDLPEPSSQDIRDILDASDRHPGLAFEDPSLGLSGDGDFGSPSEMRTRMLDTDRVNQLLAEQDQGAQRRPATPPPPAPGIESTHADILAKFGGDQVGLVAAERARLEAEVRRLRMALQAVQQQSPEAVQAAAHALRDEELGRLSGRVALLEGEVAVLRSRLEDREEELNFVTEDMIEKEDLIDQLRTEIESGTHTAWPDGQEEDLSSLEF